MSSWTGPDTRELAGPSIRTRLLVIQPDAAGRIEAPDAPILVELDRRGVEFEAKVFAELSALRRDAVVIDQSLPQGERDERTMQALSAGARLVIVPRLP